jgi:hypothetical protein
MQKRVVIFLTGQFNLKSLDPKLIAAVPDLPQPPEPKDE